MNYIQTSQTATLGKFPFFFCDYYTEEPASAEIGNTVCDNPPQPHVRLTQPGAPAGAGMAAVPAPIAGGAAAGTGPKARVLASADVRLDGLLDGGIRSVLALDRVAGPRVAGVDARPPHMPADVRAVGAAGVSAREVTELRFAVQPGLQVRAHVDYRLVAGVFAAATRRGAAARAVPRHGSAVNAGGINRRELDRISPLTVGLPTAATCDAAALAPVAGRRRATSLPATSRGAAGTWATHTFCALRSAGTPATRTTP